MQTCTHIVVAQAWNLHHVANPTAPPNTLPTYVRVRGRRLYVSGAVPPGLDASTIAKTVSLKFVRSRGPKAARYAGGAFVELDGETWQILLSEPPPSTTIIVFGGGVLQAFVTSDISTPVPPLTDEVMSQLAMRFDHKQQTFTRTPPSVAGVVADTVRRLQLQCIDVDSVAGVVWYPCKAYDCELLPDLGLPTRIRSPVDE